MSNARYLTFASAENLTAGSGLRQVQKATLHKVSICERRQTSLSAPLVFVYVAALAILDRLDEIDNPKLC